MLAGISADYYLRLERGRDRNPSAQVLESIARVLRLDEDHRAHLRSLATRPPHDGRPRYRDEQPPPGAVKLLHSLGLPAFIEGRLLDIVASNAQARAISPRLAPGGNQLRDLLLDPREQALYPDWRDMAECLVASLRQNVGNDVGDPRPMEFVTELFRESSLFGRLWTRHEVRGQSGGTVRIDHPRLGSTTLNRERLSINGAADLTLVVLHPDPVSSDVAADSSLAMS